MKYFILLFFPFVLSSCSTRFYQVSHVASETVASKDNLFMYEDSVVKINYDLWSLGGKFKFVIHNKTADTLFINWNESYLLFNKEQMHYYSEDDVTFYRKYKKKPLNLSTYPVLPVDSLIVDQVILARKLYNPEKLLLDRLPVFTFDSISSPVIMVNVLSYTDDSTLRVSKRIINRMWVKSMTVNRKNLVTYDDKRTMTYPDRFYISHDRLNPTATALTVSGTLATLWALSFGYFYLLLDSWDAI